MDECDMCPYYGIDDTCEECMKHRRDSRRHVNEYDGVDDSGYDECYKSEYGLY